MSALLERALARRAGVTKLRVDGGDVVFLAGSQEMRMGITPLTRQMNDLSGAKQRQAAFDKLLARVDETVAGKHKAKADAEQERFRKALLPVLKNKAYIAEIKARCRRQCGQSAQLLYIPLAGDIIVAAALDLPKITRFVTVGEGGPYGMSDEDIFRTAFANLNRRVGKLQLHDFGPVRALAFENDYNASLLLAPKAWESIPNLPRNLAIAVPARDIVAFADADDPQALEALRGVAKMPDKGFPVSRQLYLMNERGRFEVMP
ncbi:hypothetical protein [Bosea caraganae]|nr:hypothetical protein [Bosea caraganae]